MMILLDEKCLEPALPDPASRAVLGMLPAHVRGEGLLHPAAEVSGLPRPHHQVKMIWHHASRKDRDLDSLLRAVNQGQELLIVRGFMKNARLLVTTIQDVIAVVGDDEAGCARHDAKLLSASGASYQQIRPLDPKTQVCPRLLGNGECPH